jgi:hypothetical protein
VHPSSHQAYRHLGSKQFSTQDQKIRMEMNSGFEAYVLNRFIMSMC